MKGKLAMKDNSLDMHLKMYCDANKEYQNLYSFSCSSMQVHE